MAVASPSPIATRRYPSKSKPGKEWIVRYNTVTGQVLSCSCPLNFYQRKRCKHILAEEARQEDRQEELSWARMFAEINRELTAPKRDEAFPDRRVDNTGPFLYR